MTSLPLDMPDIENPSVKVGPLPPLILVGVLLDKVAVPPLKEREKSLVARIPEVLLAGNTDSLNVTTIFSLKSPMEVEEITGTDLSFK